MHQTKIITAIFVVIPIVTIIPNRTVMNIWIVTVEPQEALIFINLFVQSQRFHCNVIFIIITENIFLSIRFGTVMNVSIPERAISNFPVDCVVFMDSWWIHVFSKRALIFLCCCGWVYFFFWKAFLCFFFVLISLCMCVALCLYSTFFVCLPFFCYNLNEILV